MVILEQSVRCACVHCVNNQSLELIDFFLLNLIYSPLSLMYLMNSPNTVSCM